MLRLLLLLSAVAFVAGCTTTKEIGSRGDVTLYRTKSWWPMAYPYSIGFDRVPLDRPGRYHFDVTGLREAPMTRFDLRVHSAEPLVDQSGGHLNKSPLPSAGFRSCAIHLGISDNRGNKLHAETLRFSEKTWFVESKRRGKYWVSYPTRPDCPDFPEGDFSITVEVISPSRTSGDYLKIQGMGFPAFEPEAQTTANKRMESNG